MYTRTNRKTLYALDIILSKRKPTFRNLNKVVQEFHRKLVLASADKAANNALVVLKICYINTQKPELSTANTYEHN